MMLILILKPHIERGAYHLDRFDAYLGDELICTARSGWHEPARKLLDLGHSPDTLLHVQHAGKPHDPTIKPQPIGELAQWMVEETKAGGMRRRRWRPVDIASPASADASEGIGVPQAA